MKKPIAILFVIVLTLSACLSSPEGVTSTPQATVTSEVTATLTPVPTQTLTPLPAEVVEAQKYFEDKGFEVTPDGKIIDQALGKEIAELSSRSKIIRIRHCEPRTLWRSNPRIYERDCFVGESTLLAMTMFFL